jgi:hypothetical protein
MKKAGNTMGTRKKASATAKVSKVANTVSAPLSDEQLIELARGAVSPRLRGNARVVRPAAAYGLAKKNMAAGVDLSSEVAKLVGAKLPAEDPSAAAVEFVADTPLGKRHTMVHVRGNKVTSVVTRASR